MMHMPERNSQARSLAHHAAFRSSMGERLDWYLFSHLDSELPVQRAGMLDSPGNPVFTWHTSSLITVSANRLKALTRVLRNPKKSPVMA